MTFGIFSLFENVALGLTTDRPSAAMLAASIALHQPAESIALLVACLKTSMSTSSIVKALGLYSIVGPLGVVAGVLISKISNPVVEAIVVALTAGTFLYVGATEVDIYLLSNIRLVHLTVTYMFVCFVCLPWSH